MEHQHTTQSGWNRLNNSNTKLSQGSTRPKTQVLRNIRKTLGEENLIPITENLSKTM